MDHPPTVELVRAALLGGGELSSRTSPTARLRQCIFAVRESIRLQSNALEPEEPRAAPTLLLSHVLNDDDGGRAHTVLQRAQSMHWQRRQDLERAFEAREAYREERRCALQDARKAATNQRVQDWLLVLHIVAPGLALRHLLQRCHATRVLRALLLPVLHRWAAHQRQRLLCSRQEAALWAQLGRPSETLLEGLPFFALLPLDAKSRLLTSLYPIQFEAGRLIMLEGEPGDEMFFLVSGRVQVVVRKNGTCKSRRDDNGTVVAALGAGDHFGEFAVMNAEPRVASVQCAEPVVCWALKREAFQWELRQFPTDDPRRQRMKQCILQRRMEVMERLHPLTPSQLLELPLFAGLPMDSLMPLLP
eukprot:EG_transcript_17511